MGHLKMRAGPIITPLSRRAALTAGAAVLISAAWPACAADAIEVVDAWLRPPLAKGVPAVAYMTLIDRSGRGDTLVGIDTGGDGTADLHETTTTGGVMRMRPLAALAI